MPITAGNITEWIKAQPGVDLAALEGGARLRQRFASFLASEYPDVLSEFLKRAKEKGGAFEAEQAMASALSEITSSGLHGIAEGGKSADILSQWTQFDEDAYELLNQLRHPNDTA